MTNPTPYFDKTFDNYWYDHQFVDILIQFMAVFAGMKIQIGENSFNSQTNKVIVPIRRGNADRVVNSIISSGSNAMPIRVPMLSAEIVQISKAPDKQKGREAVVRDVTLPVGGDIENDIKVVYKRTPTPYYVFFDLSIITSNDDQKYQILEQILTVFDPDIQLQINDDIENWSKFLNLVLDDIKFENEYPYQTDRKLIVTSLQFSTIAYLQTPITYKSNFIKSIKMRLNALQENQDLYQNFVNNALYSDQGYEEIANLSELEELNNLKM